jgi:hypothetical protein
MLGATSAQDQGPACDCCCATVELLPTRYEDLATDTWWQKVLGNINVCCDISKSLFPQRQREISALRQVKQLAAALVLQVAATWHVL